MNRCGASVRALSGALFAAAMVFAWAVPASAQAQDQEPGETNDFMNPFETVAVQDLSQVGTGLIGLMGEENGGLSPDAWVGTERLVVEILLPRLSGQPGSPVLADLSRRLLLSRTKPPVGATRGGADLFAARLSRLVAIGQVGAVEPMAEQAGGNGSAPSVMGPRVDSLFFQRRDGEACDLVNMARGQAQSASWIKRIALCDGLSGNVTGARLGVDLLAETGDPDAAFSVLMARLVDKSEVALTSVSDLSAVHFALLRQTGAELPAGVVSRVSGGFGAAYAALGEAPIEQRILAAEAAIAAGSIPTGALKSLYALVEAPDAAPSAPENANANTAENATKAETAAPVDPTVDLARGPLGAARAYQLYQTSQSPAERAALLVHILRDARSRGAGAAVAHVFRTEINSLAATEETGPFAFELGVAELVAGDAFEARRWYGLLQSMPGASAAHKDLLAALIQLSGQPGGDWTGDAAADFIQRSSGTDRELAIFAYALNRTLGMAASDKAYHASLTGALSSFGAVPNSAPLAGLITASSKKRSGETLLFALAIMAEGGVSGAHGSTILSVVGALRRAGFDNEARALAIEALVARLP